MYGEHDYDYDYDDDYLDELYAANRKDKLLAQLRRIEPGHPDEADLIDALNELEEDEA